MTSSAHTGRAPCQCHRVCPWWMGWMLANPLRTLVENPRRLTAGLVEEGHHVLEVGPGMGFFTVPIAEQVGTNGRVVCVDLQPRMLTGLKRRLIRKGLLGRVETRECSPTDLRIQDLAKSMDLAALIHVLHESPDPQAMLGQVAAALRPGGRMLLMEPKGHCCKDLFAAELEAAKDAGLQLQNQKLDDPGRNLKAIFQRPVGS